jgi:hypothetical protein
VTDPSSTGGTLYVVDRLTLHAPSPTDGSTRWVTEYDEDDFDQPTYLGSDISADGRRIYVPGCDGLHALGRSDGERAWFVASALRRGVGVADGRVYANAEDPLAIDADGWRRWQVETNSVVGTVVAGEDLLYAANNERLFAIDRSIVIVPPIGVGEPTASAVPVVRLFEGSRRCYVGVEHSPCPATPFGRSVRRPPRLS